MAAVSGIYIILSFLSAEEGDGLSHIIGVSAGHNFLYMNVNSTFKNTIFMAFPGMASNSCTDV